MSSSSIDDDVMTRAGASSFDIENFVLLVTSSSIMTAKPTVDREVSVQQ